LGNTNQLAGMGAAGQIPGLAMAPGQAQYNAANLQQNLPLANMGNYESLLTPLAQLGQSSSGNNTGQTSNQFQGQNTQQQTQTQQTQTPLWQQLAGLGIAGASMFGGNPMGAFGSLGNLFGGNGGLGYNPMGGAMAPTGGNLMSNNGFSVGGA
jgi:hypothetical protein